MSSIEKIKMQTAEEIAAKLDIQVKRAMAEAAPENRPQRLVQFNYEPPPPPPEGVCPTCHGLACIRYDVAYGHPAFGKLFPCPDCDAGKEAANRRQLRMFADAQMPKEYRDYKLHHFMPRRAWPGGLPEELIEGKRLGIGMAWQFVHTPGHWMSEREVYRRWCGYYDLAGYEIPAKWVERAATASNTYRRWLVLHGVNGTGKTALASAIANELMLRGIPTLYIRVDDYIQKVTATNNPDSDEVKKDGLTEIEVVQTARDANVLILDDMNVSKVSDYGLKIMEMVIRYRHNNDKPTIITLNASETEFEEQWQPRITSAVFGVSHWTPFGGAPLRDERHSLDTF